MLSQKALIVCLSVSQWGARKKDKKAQKTASAAHNADSSALHVTKRLIQAKQLQAISAEASAIRDFWRDNTLPWNMDGSRIIKSDAIMEFMTEFKRRKNAFEIAVNSFLTDYAQLRTEAKAKLGDLFNESDYPDEGCLKMKFSCNIDLQPIAEVDDFRIQLSDEEKNEYVRRRTEVLEGAMREAWTKLYEVTKHAAEKLTDPNAQFKNSSISNVTEMTKLLTKLNVTDDPALEAARLEVEKIASGISPDVMRDNASERAKAAQALNQVTEKLKGFAGIF